MTNEQLTSSSDVYSNDVMSVSYEIIASDNIKVDPDSDTLIHTDNDDDNDNDNEKTNHINQQKLKQYTVVSYGPINVRVSLRSTPTLLSGRRSKFFPLEGEAATKRELRREKNRRTARKLKERQINIERQLLTELEELESKEKDLVEEIGNLTSYKEFLENRSRQQPIVVKKEINEQTLRRSSMEENQSQEDVQTQSECTPTATTEYRSSSPEWQLLFSI